MSNKKLREKTPVKTKAKNKKDKKPTTKQKAPPPPKAEREKEKPVIDMREFRGARLFNKGHIIVTPTAFYVQSERGPEIYEVTNLKECECLDYQTRQLKCKHIFAVEFYLQNEKQQVVREQKAKEMVI